MLKADVLLHIFWENCDTFNFSEIYDEYKVQKNSIYLKQKYSVAI